MVTEGANSDKLVEESLFDRMTEIWLESVAGKRSVQGLRAREHAWLVASQVIHSRMSKDRSGRCSLWLSSLPVGHGSLDDILKDKDKTMVVWSKGVTT